MSTPELDLLTVEYRETNTHLRAKMTEFVSWSGFFLTFSFIAAAAFAALYVTGPSSAAAQQSPCISLRRRCASLIYHSSCLSCRHCRTMR
jgi:hypothetical protein